jgi:predicted permease
MDFSHLSHIAIAIIAPVILMTGVGFLLGWRRILEPEPIATLYMTVFTPAMALKGWLAADLSGGDLANVFLFSILVAVALQIVANIISRFLGHDRAMRGAFANGAVMYNSANYGLPVQKMAFGERGGNLQTLVLMIQSLVAFTLGSFNAASNSPNMKATAIQVLKMPVMWATILGGLIHWRTNITWSNLETNMPMLWAPLNFFQDALVPVALISLGVQLSRVKVHGKALVIVLACFLRLVLGPLAGLGIGLAMGLRGEMLAILVVSVSFPTAVFSSVVASSFKNHEDFAAAQVFVSTVASIVTVTLVIYLSKVYIVPLT